MLSVGVLTSTPDRAGAHHGAVSVAFQGATVTVVVTQTARDQAGGSAVRRLVLIIGMLALLVSSVAMPATAAASFSTTLVQDGFSHPIHVTNAGDSRLFVVEQNGLIKIIHDDKSVTTFLDLSSIVVQNGGEQGLLGLAFHPNYASNGPFYVYYSPADGKHEVLAEYKRSSGDPDVADPNSQRIL